MHKSKRILAIVGVIILLGLYITTLISAIISRPNAASLFQASLFCTFVIPVLIYIYGIFYKIATKKDDKKEK